MRSLAQRFASDISFEYSLIDRMRVRGHVMALQNVGMLGQFFRQFRGVSWMEPHHLQRATDEFVQYVEQFAQQHGIPILIAQPGENHVDQAAPFLAAVANRSDAVYCIIKVQEQTSSFVSYVPKRGRDKTRRIARGRRRINHYYFFIKDHQFGSGNWIRIASYAPFTVTVCFNGHNFAAQQLRLRRIPFETRDNLFVSVTDPAALQRIARSLTHQAIARFCDRWVYRCIPLFSRAARQAGYRYRWFTDQVEYSHNLIFQSPDRLNPLFARLLDQGRAIGQPHVISRLFQRRLHARRTGMRLYRTRQEDYCLKAWHKKTYIKQYNKQGIALRTETCTHDVREFGTKKALKHLGYLLHAMELCNRRLLRWQDTIDRTTVSTGFLEKLGQPTVRANGRRIPGIRLDSRRMTRLLAAVLQFGHLVNGFSNRELRSYVARRFGLSPEEYTAAQLRYDLLKLHAKGLIRKLPHRTRYVIAPKGLVQATALAKLHECLNGTLGEPIDSAPPAGCSPQSDFQKRCRQVRSALHRLLKSCGLHAA